MFSSDKTSDKDLINIRRFKMFRNIVNRLFMTLSIALTVGGLAFAINNSSFLANKTNCYNSGACCLDGTCPDSPCCQDGTCNSFAKVSKKADCCPDGACCPNGPCCEVVKN